MKRIGFLLLIVLALAAATTGLYISAANRDIVVIDLLFWPSISLRAGLWLVLAFTAGAVTGLLVAGTSSLWRRVRQPAAASGARRGGRR